MARHKRFLRTIRFILEDLVIFLLETAAESIKSLAGFLFQAMVELIKETAKEVAKESKIFIIWCIIFAFGGIVLLFEKQIPVNATHHEYLSNVGIAILLSSISMIIFQILKAILDTLGLFQPLTRLRDKIIEKNKLGDKKPGQISTTKPKIKKPRRKAYKKQQIDS